VCVCVCVEWDSPSFDESRTHTFNWHMPSSVDRGAARGGIIHSAGGHARRAQMELYSQTPNAGRESTCGCAGLVKAAELSGVSRLFTVLAKPYKLLAAAEQ
jgi:hypothetical protein